LLDGARQEAAGGGTVLSIIREILEEKGLWDTLQDAQKGALMAVETANTRWDTDHMRREIARYRLALVEIMADPRSDTWAQERARHALNIT
jgi:hypothetical protein